MASASSNPKNVTVVGGSVAGMYTAGLLARGGARVELLERAERLEPISRTLIVTSHMRDLLGAAGESCIVNEIKRFELFTDGRAATIDLAAPRFDYRARHVNPQSGRAGAKSRRADSHGPQISRTCKARATELNCSPSAAPMA